MIPATILLVDDDAFVRQAIVDKLCHVGYTVVQARHGQEALDLLRVRKVRPDLIVTDLEMPGVNGFALIQAIQADPGISKIPILLCSGNAEIGGVGAQLGVRTHTKWDPLRVLRETVREMLGPKGL